MCCIHCWICTSASAPMPPLPMQPWRCVNERQSSLLSQAALSGAHPSLRQLPWAIALFLQLNTDDES